MQEVGNAVDRDRTGADDRDVGWVWVEWLFSSLVIAEHGFPAHKKPVDVDLD
jgi:hypothetical protein